MLERKYWEEDGRKAYLVNRSYATSETMLPEPDWVQVHVDYISFSIDSTELGERRACADLIALSCLLMPAVS
jgi:hypothetical protein